MTDYPQPPASAEAERALMRVEAESYEVNIYIAGDPITARQALREFCEEGLCVTVTDTEYIYTGGSEVGVIVGLINYPRFPKAKGDIWDTSERLANFLRRRLHQDSVLVQDNIQCLWMTRRKE